MMEFVRFVAQDVGHFIGFLVAVCVLGGIAIEFAKALRGDRS